MLKALIRMGAFFGKELNEVRRQPRLVLSLVFGPFLILCLFGVGYKGDQPVLRTALVVPEGSLAPAELRALTDTLLLNFDLVSVDADEAGALARLDRDDIDLVQVFPADIRGQVQRNEQAQIGFTYRESSPVNERWIQYLAYAQVNEMNRALLLQGVAGAQGEAAGLTAQLAEVRGDLDRLDSALPEGDQAASKASLAQLKTLIGGLLLNPFLLGQLAGPDRSPAQVREELAQTQADIDALDQALDTQTIGQQQERLSMVRAQVVRLEEASGLLTRLSPQVIISPLKEQYHNLNGVSFDLMAYYAPGVVALLIQHIAVTLGALSLVRERLIGAAAFFRVAPVSSTQMMIGKYLSYLLFIGIIAGLLIGLLALLGVPLPAYPLALVGLIVLLTLAALGVGFCISIISQSDSQAIQLSMLLLLLSIFFSGFLMPLENFLAPVRIVGYMLPITHGINGLQATLLQGGVPTLFTWAGLSTITALTLLFVIVFGRRQFRQA
jgi:ABC-2 type transport system permease protein